MQDTLQDLIKDITAGVSFNRAANMLVTRVTNILNCNICSLFILDAKTEHLQLIANEGYLDLDPKQISVPPHTGVVGLVVERKEPLNLTDVNTHPAVYHINGHDEHAYPNFLGVPILHQQRILGVLLAQDEHKVFSEDDEGFLTSLATSFSAQVSHAIATNEIELDASIAMLHEEQHFRGFAGSPGIATGIAVLRHPPTHLDVSFRLIEKSDIEDELREFNGALRVVVEELTKGRERMMSVLGPEEIALFDAYLHMLDDEAIPQEVRTTIVDDCVWSQSAVSLVFNRHIRELERSENSYLAERGQDLRDLGQRLLAAMQHRDGDDTDIPPNTILVAQEITTTMLSEVSRENLSGVVSIEGSMNSHATILARALDLPAVIGATDLPLLDIEDLPLIVDGFYGEIVVSPTAATTEHFDALTDVEESFQLELDEIGDLPTETLDGVRINVWVNIGLVSEISRSLDRGAEGIGLFRTEVPFASRNRFPTEEEQRRIYREHMEAFDPRPVTMRTLDIGGDKDLPYFPIKEDNPFLGWRGIRVTLDHPDIFLGQVRAMFKANADLEGILRIMLPMVSNLEEITTAKSYIDQAYREVCSEGINAKQPQIGVLIEVPSLIFQRQQVVKMVDFLAVGTNDLTQYMLAASRTNPQIARLYHEFDPAMVHSLRMLAKTAHEAKKPIGICGELAGTVEGAVLCIGMGYDVLSMNATHIPRVKWVIRKITMTNCRRIVARVLRMNQAAEIVAFIREQLQGAGLEKALPPHEPPQLFL
ncbi:MAG: phosphoenolpyruvate--protein phosphotransferase [Gammaproteobacteria bacterium]|nr:phosphoenolpyruvate--protein phosphotransferase [Gammaproteobacteria bacterium]